MGTSPLPAAFFSARASSRCFFSCFVSGRYLCASFSSCVAGSPPPVQARTPDCGAHWVAVLGGSRTPRNLGTALPRGLRGSGTAPQSQRSPVRVPVGAHKSGNRPRFPLPPPSKTSLKREGISGLESKSRPGHGQVLGTGQRADGQLSDRSGPNTPHRTRRGPTCLAVQGLRELVDGRGHLQALVEDRPLPLQPDVARPLDKAGEVPLGLDVLPCGGKGGSERGPRPENPAARPRPRPRGPGARAHAPMPKFLGRFSNRGFTTFLASCFFTTAGAGATFLPLAFFPFGCAGGKAG